MTWLEDKLSVNNRPNKLAVYHVPLYPSFRPYDTALSAEMREKWGPVFDKYSLTVALENHDHDYKRTKPLKNGEVSVAATSKFRLV